MSEYFKTDEMFTQKSVQVFPTFNKENKAVRINPSTFLVYLSFSFIPFFAKLKLCNYN